MTLHQRGTISLGDMYIGSMTLVEPTVKYLKLIHEAILSLRTTEHQLTDHSR